MAGEAGPDGRAPIHGFADHCEAMLSLPTAAFARGGLFVGMTVTCVSLGQSFGRLVSHSEFSRIRQAKFSRFTIDRLIVILGLLGQEVTLSVSVHPRTVRKAVSLKVDRVSS